MPFGQCNAATTLERLKDEVCLNILVARQVEFNGHMVSSDVISTRPDRTKAIQDLNVPTNGNESKVIIGLYSYFK